MQYTMRPETDRLHIDLEGAFTFMDSRHFRSLLEKLRSDSPSLDIYLNVSRLESMDTTALNLLMMAHDMAKLNRRSLVFEGAQGMVQEALQDAARYNCLSLAV